jgi:hypothetical protein
MPFVLVKMPLAGPLLLNRPKNYYPDLNTKSRLPLGGVSRLFATWAGGFTS